MKTEHELINRNVRNPEVSAESPNRIGTITKITDGSMGIIEFRDFHEYWSMLRIKDNLIPLVIPLSEQWPEVQEIAEELVRDISIKINNISVTTHPEIKKDIGTCGYWRQGLLELVIAELEKRV